MINCPNIQAELTAYFQTCDSAMLREPMPFFDFLWSDINVGGIQQVIHPANGKVKTVELRYDKRLSEDSVDEVSSCNSTCDSKTNRTDYVQTYSIDPCEKLQISEAMSADQFSYACQSNDMIVAKKIQLMIDALVRKMATRLTNQASGMLGNWANDTYNLCSSQWLATQLWNGTAPNPMAMADIDFAMQNTGFCGTTAIFAGQEMYRYSRAINAGCCTQNGVDISQITAQYGKAILYDYRVNNALGHYTSVVLQAGSLIPIYYVQNNSSLMQGIAQVTGNQNAMIGTNYYKTVIQDPQSGMPMDLTIADNCGTISIVIEANATLITLPSLYDGDDRLYGVTGFAGITSDC